MKFYISAVAGTLLMLLAACTPEADTIAEAAHFGGNTMGTTYNITLVEAGDRARVQSSVDSLLKVINEEASTYDPNSLISRLNRGDTLRLPLLEDVEELQQLPGAHLAANLTLARMPYEHSGGLFDPTVGPLAEYYGFGSAGEDTSRIDPNRVAELVKLVGFDKVVQTTTPDGQLVFLQNIGMGLDLSAIAKGYAVDQVGELLAKVYHLDRWLVEIGGETKTAGLSPRGTPWVLAINAPDETASTRDVEVLLSLSNLAVATSGNYRNVRIKGGERVVHTIDPRTGAARASSLLSATIIAPSCATADAYATACMAAGELAPEVLAKADLSGCLIFAGTEGRRYDIRYINDFRNSVIAEEN